MKILLVEDSKQLNKALAAVLKRNSFVVDSAFDGEEALFFIKEFQYDAIILDVMLPEINGIEVLKKARQDGLKTPVIMLTAKSTTEDKIVGLDAGADDYLTKPFVVKELMARIRALTRRNNSILNTYSYKDIILDPNTYELKSKNVVKLTSKEFKLMEFLIKNQGIFVSTEKILSSVWEFDSDVDVSVIWVFISTLRKHLESAGSNLTIKASRGIGYRLEEK